MSGIFSRNPHSSALPIRENYEAKNVDELATLLQSLFASELQGIIAIDGRDGVGKSQLAAQLHERIGGTLISLDNYIEDALGIYVPALSINRLRKAVVDAAPPRLVEGVCLHDVLKAIDCNSTVNIYVRRLIGGSYWCHEATCDPVDSVEDIIACEVENLRQFAEANARIAGMQPPASQSIRLTPFREEIIRYHARVRPYRVADIVVSLAE